MQDLFHHAAVQDPIDLWQQIPSDWQAICDTQISKGLLEKISQQLLAAKRAGQEIAPAPENIFRALQLCSVKQARVVILGQDPYQTPGLAQGLAFSIPKEIQPGWRAFPSYLDVSVKHYKLMLMVLFSMAISRLGRNRASYS